MVPYTGTFTCSPPMNAQRLNSSSSSSRYLRTQGQLLMFHFQFLLPIPLPPASAYSSNESSKSLSRSSLRVSKSKSRSALVVSSPFDESPACLNGPQKLPPFSSLYFRTNPSLLLFFALHLALALALDRSHDELYFRVQCDIINSRTQTQAVMQPKNATTHGNQVENSPAVRDP